MKDQTTVAERIKEAVAAQDIERLKLIRDQIGRDQWLKAWRDQGSKMEGFLGDNPFVAWD